MLPWLSERSALPSARLSLGATHDSRDQTLLYVKRYQSSGREPERSNRAPAQDSHQHPHGQPWLIRRSVQWRADLFQEAIGAHAGRGRDHSAAPSEIFVTFVFNPGSGPAKSGPLEGTPKILGLEMALLRTSWELSLFRAGLA